MSIEHELIAFSDTLPQWQQDLVRRICTQTELSPGDLELVTRNLKASQGLNEAGEHISPLRNTTSHSDPRNDLT